MKLGLNIGVNSNVIIPNSSGGGGYSSLILANSPTAYWRLNDTSGTTAIDEVGSYNGTIDGSPTLGEASLLASTDGSSILFAGNTAQRVKYIDLPVVTVKTIECITKPDLTTNSYFFSLFTGIDNRIDFEARTDGRFNVYNDGLATFSIASQFVADNIYHIALVDDGVNSTLYLNGSSIGTLANRTLNLLTTLVDVYIGVRNYDGTIYNPFYGHIQEVAIYETDLNSATILEHANTVLGV